ncbi:hypothetical protein Cantr_00031 [Candida viswanathii]|uniref:Uncharacterized protein n=1 Tax=Candida viswanathii TaxID=5486 RepID=A0A367YFM0_9ASCO|nr:hypothetical protein Cantr_00031 [Candida viswanathii]
MKRSFSVTSLKNTNSVDYHPLTDNNEEDDNNNHHNSNNNDNETMEHDEYDSDNLSCSSCLSTPSKSNFSFLFDNGSHTTTTTTTSATSIPMARPPSYSYSYSNSSILSTLTGSNLSFSRASPSSLSSRVYIPASISTVSVSCSPITSTSVSSPSSVDTTGRRKSLCRSPSSDSLYVILKKSNQTPSPLGNNNTSHVKSMYSNLTSSLRSFRNKLSSYNKENIISFIMDSPRLTDDKLPQVPETEEQKEEDENEEADGMQELTTFGSSGTSCCNKLGLARIKYKTREQRSNSEFMRLYAFDHLARTRSLTLPNYMTHDELKRMVKVHPQLKSFHHKYNLHRISSLSKDKLWKSVILPPRNDDSPGLYIDGENYVYAEGEEQIPYSIVRKQGVYLPWVLKQTIRPAGVLPKSKCVFNSEAPNSGVTNCQYTVKGWCNPRWIDTSSEEEY